MNVISELGNELAVAVLVEKKHNEKINTQEALNLIRNVQAVLSSSAVGVNRISDTPNPSAQDDAKKASH